MAGGRRFESGRVHVWVKSSRCSQANNCVEVAWRKSSYSLSATDCVEVAEAPDRVLVRDSKDPDGPVLAFDPGAWRAFIGAVRDGEL